VLCHSRTKDIGAIKSSADHRRRGRKTGLEGEMVAPGAIAVDVGTTVVDVPVAGMWKRKASRRVVGR
jgi:5,10-methylene-tetrahydrofolate dehydrogenase/methenyl tetrahydrofolate cyclohydrolase